MDKAVNFILHTERFDGQLLFNPRLALGQGTISSALPSLRSLPRREHSGRKNSRLDFIVMLLNDSLTEGPYPTLPPPSLVHMSHHDRTTSMNTFPLLSPRAFWISSAWSIALVLFALFLLGACTNEQDRDATQVTQQELKEFKQDFQTSLEAANREIQQVVQRVDTSAEQAEGELGTQINEIEQRREQLKKELNQLEEAGREKRRELQSELYQLEADLKVVRLIAIETKEVFAQAVHKEIQAINEEINRLDQTIENAGSEIRSEYQEQIADLQDQRAQLEKDITGRLEEASEEMFKGLQTPMAEDLAALRREVKEISYEVEHALRSESADRKN